MRAALSLLRIFRSMRTLPILAIGRRPPASGFQEATQGCGGAFGYTIQVSARIGVPKECDRYRTMLTLASTRTESEYTERGANYATD